MSEECPLPCRSCLRLFKRAGDLSNHYTQNKRCNWVLHQHNSDPPNTIIDYGAPDDYEDDPPSFDEASEPDAMDIVNDAAYFVAPASPVTRNHPSTPPAPLQPPQPLQSKRARVEDCLDEDAEVRELFPGSGKVYGRDLTVHEAYLAKAGLTNGIYGPFVSKLDFNVGQWAKQSKIPDNSLTRLLAIPGVGLLPLSSGSMY